jgi:hypothetical protein
MAGFASTLAIGGVLAGLVFAGGIEAGQSRPTPTLPQFSPQPRIMPPIQLAPSQRLPPRFPQEQRANPDTRPLLPEIRVDPYVVCGMTIIPAPPNVDPNMTKPRPERTGPAPRQVVPLIRRVPPPTCATADARPRYPDAPRNR